MENFKWRKALQETAPRLHRGREYKLEAAAFGPNFRVDLIVNGSIEIRDNTGNKSFLDLVDEKKPLAEQILAWGDRMVAERAKPCPRCGEEKIVNSLEPYDMERKSFAGYTELCSTCRSAIYNEEMAEDRKARELEDEEYRKELENNPPVIVGGFTEKEAVRYLKRISNPDIEQDEDGYAICKGVLRANDGTFYPVFLGIDLTSSGEHCATYFLASNREDVIDQRFAFPYLNKPLKEQLYPYKYRTLVRIPGDIHQPNWPDFT